jgi:hypothetical protein
MVAASIGRTRLCIVTTLIGVATLLQQACGDDSAPLGVDTTPPTVVLRLATTNITSPGNLGLSAKVEGVLALLHVVR